VGLAVLATLCNALWEAVDIPLVNGGDSGESCSSLKNEMKKDGADIKQAMTMWG
jgi:hypothetical protein